ncbi:NAD(P)H-dependent oxidoreductase [Streptomyces sp. AV19]|uniref:NADPH-dependent FMN reductase n=1 Tax=Streptomyces sp. AV19 TaxID=2793068 RepID=UPI0018FED055|nr:NAD(P)H-dependent oxidoreductase [Streptomyces sp. AV19]MBH1933261.1 NAD(P)H-dependent oxidoreductase [Streptomyces sp. AV19]MDG4530640.1 NAD(P)H-dependent oxidoreductase [Streptomyces sp. AV19]
MNTTPLRLAVIVGSTREGRFGPVVADWFAERSRVHAGMEIDVIDLAEVDIPLVLSGEPNAGVATITPRLAAADAFVVVTPEYNHSYPASLKAAIDWHFTQWQGKPVGFVSYGGISGGLRAVEHLRQVFAELHTVTVRETVSFPMAWEKFDEDGKPLDGTAANGAAKRLLDQLLWWGHALRDAREKIPYAA